MWPDHGASDLSRVSFPWGDYLLHTGGVSWGHIVNLRPVNARRTHTPVACTDSKTTVQQDSEGEKGIRNKTG